MINYFMILVLAHKIILRCNFSSWVHIRVKTSTIMVTNTEGAAPAAWHMITIDYFNLMSSLTFISNNLKTLVAKVDRLDGLMESLPSL